MFSFGQTPLGLTFGAPPAPPALGSISVSPSKNVGFDFGSGIVPGGAVARDQIMGRSSPHKTRTLPSAPTKLGSEEPLYPSIEDDLDGKPEGLAQGLKHDGEPGPSMQEEQEEDGEPSSEEEEEEEEADAPDTGSSSSSPLFVRKTKKKRSLTQIKARNKARREAAKSQKQAGNRE
ncbi:hypothetical protein BGZ52_006120 [Haplosporangium bisporale]|nr:hypothetical protein BGZ52_006120 [Haplosporangium bisporale]